MPFLTFFASQNLSKRASIVLEQHSAFKSARRKKEFAIAVIGKSNKLFFLISSKLCCSWLKQLIFIVKAWVSYFWDAMRSIECCRVEDWVNYVEAGCKIRINGLLWSGNRKRRSSIGFWIFVGEREDIKRKVTENKSSSLGLECKSPNRNH